MNAPRRTALFVSALLFGGWLSAVPAARAVNDIEAQMYERAAAFARARAEEVMKKAEDAPGESSTMLVKAAENLRALADTKLKISQKVRTGNLEGLDELKKADEEYSRKAMQLREQLRGMGFGPMEGPIEGRIIRRMGGENRDAVGSPPAEGSTGGFRPREKTDRKPGVVVVNSADELRNWLDEEEARVSAK